MKKKIAIYGAGGLGREIRWLLSELNDRDNRWEIVGFFDDAKSPKEVVDGLSIVGGIELLNRIDYPLDLVIGIADPAIKAGLLQRISNPKIDFPVIIHPACLAGDHRNTLRRGSVLTAGVILTTGIEIGEFVLVNLATTIGHDVNIGDYSSIMPGCSISGSVTIEPGCTIGTGARILQNVHIGRDATVGAGAVVTRDVDADATVIGIPATKVNR